MKTLTTTQDQDKIQKIREIMLREQMAQHLTKHYDYIGHLDALKELGGIWTKATISQRSAAYKIAEEAWGFD